MTIDFHHWTLMTALRWILSGLGAGIIVYVFWVLAEANVRNWVEERGWDKLLARALEKMPDFRPYRRFWFGVGLVLGAALITWLAWAFPSVMVDAAVPSYSQAELDKAVKEAKDTPPVGFTQKQVDERIADATKQLKTQLDQANNDIQGLRAVAKATPQNTQSDTPIAVEKLPTSLQLNFKGNDIEEISSKNVTWTKIVGFRQTKSLIPVSYPAWTIVIFFKKPIAFKYVRYDDHGVGLPEPEQLSDVRHAEIELNWFTYNGLLDISFSNERSK
jgi:hypothetical protein